MKHVIFIILMATTMHALGKSSLTNLYYFPKTTAPINQQNNTDCLLLISHLDETSSQYKKIFSYINEVMIKKNGFSYQITPTSWEHHGYILQNQDKNKSSYEFISCKLPTSLQVIHSHMTLQYPSHFKNFDREFISNQYARGGILWTFSPSLSPENAKHDDLDFIWNLQPAPVKNIHIILDLPKSIEIKTIAALPSRCAITEVNIRSHNRSYSMKVPINHCRNQEYSFLQIKDPDLENQKPASYNTVKSLWPSKPCSSSYSCEVSMSAIREVMQEFIQKHYPLHIQLTWQSHHLEKAALSVITIDPATGKSSQITSKFDISPRSQNQVFQNRIKKIEISTESQIQPNENHCEYIQLHGKQVLQMLGLPIENIQSLIDKTEDYADNIKVTKKLSISFIENGKKKICTIPTGFEAILPHTGGQP